MYLYLRWFRYGLYGGLVPRSLPTVVYHVTLAPVMSLDGTATLGNRQFVRCPIGELRLIGMTTTRAECA